MGAWGLAVLERLFAVVHENGRDGAPVTVHVVEPGEPGVGVYSLELPGYLLMNTPCGQISLFPDEASPHGLPYEVGLFEWALARGYAWRGDVCEAGNGGEPITEHDFLPRRVAGRYLKWFYETLTDCAPRGIRLVRHRDRALNVHPVASGREVVGLASGVRLEVDQVVLTTGHTANAWNAGSIGSALVRDVDLSRGAAPAAGAAVAICGMGLVAADLLAQFTTGRGGTFVSEAGRLRYVASGQEPKIRLLSRSGLPYCAKATQMRNITTIFRPAIWTPEAVEELRWRSRGEGREGALNWEQRLFPLLLGEMTLQYYTQASVLADGASAASELRGSLVSAWYRGDFAASVRGFRGHLGHFDPMEHFFPDLGPGLATSEGYQQFVWHRVASDLREAEFPGGASPVKMAYEVLRFLRDPIRRAVEFGGLDDESHRAFFPGVSGRIARLVAGPPAVRSRQLLALMDAGVVRVPYGPAPAIEPDGAGGAVVRSTRLAREYSEHVDLVVQAYHESPALDRSASPLIQNLYREGRLCPMWRGGAPVVGGGGG
ncbi:MAG: FAD/NAD(P)-binding protein, partial [Acidimicrobiales bacterium]